MTLQASHLTLRYGRRAVLRDVGLDFDPTGITGIVGPNGSGKSSLLRCLAGLCAPSQGSVSMDGRAIRDWPARKLSRRLAFLPQSPQAPDGLTLRDLVAHGRFSHRGFFRTGRGDQAAIDHALEQTGLTALAGRAFDSLSGGERQRGWIAMALAQQSGMLLLDEPTTWLDIGHQIEVLELLRRLNRQDGLGIVMVLHDLNHAAAYADRIVAIKDGAVCADGPPHQVVVPALIQNLFGVAAQVVDLGTEHAQRPHVVVTSASRNVAYGHG
ncbi:ABC transporter ATP-binding protein [Paracoccus caeni]|uniref:ABC transporter ATP-binding protein n=1 Tax=Paracoccus caeni TaxID=657651 RepID=A0A934W0A1_9RHOB|nr:ABC transporter ATP-binding protein [Paracoccus caeni]MBK4217877.1 ABC transporter ATP-binding protein [Paracoccus caeni]